jgi:GT2 family glycosyltransferase
MIETTVVILNWNGARLLPACLSALARQTYRDFELVLVDNGSIDGSLRLLADLASDVQPHWLAAPLPRRARLVLHADNLGFAEGNNIALRDLHTPLVALLNNDAIADPYWLARLVDAMKAGGPPVGSVASTMLFSHRPDVVASAGLRIHTDGVALDCGVGQSLSSIEKAGTRPVFGASAGAALYRSEMLRDVGLLDARFFSYLEDADLAWRARSRGWRALFEPRATVRHEYSATGGHNSAFKTTLVARNRVWLLYKNMPEVLLRRHWSSILRYDAFAVAGGLLNRNRYVLRGRLQGLRRLPQLRTDRLKTLTSARLHPDEMDSLLAPAMTPRQYLGYRSKLDRLVSQDALPESGADSQVHHLQASGLLGLF